MIPILKDFWRGFVGGPELKFNMTHKFNLENKQLSITLPDSNVMAAPSSVDVHFPYSSKSWFENNTEESPDQHIYVHVFTENWMYLPVISMIPGDEFGMLSCQLRIKQTDKINVLDKQALAVFVIQAYNDFHNGPNGINTEIRQEITEQSSKKATPWTPEKLQEEIDGWIENRGKPLIPAAQMIKFNQNDWIFYQEVRSNRLSRYDYYCLPLSENSFLEVKFNYRVDRSDKFKKWEKHALASQELIMESISLAPIPLDQDNLLVDNTAKD
ncbi:hypothetical protein ACPUVO_10055 [Pseudocolwellia sp. HL-MZ19]|uniref:hypothetical protein n=1 Tax=Pseudocolwellia sp. HL-MZ19 TaxID=3400846 RepID=UPI003CFA6694